MLFSYHQSMCHFLPICSDNGQMSGTYDLSLTVWEHILNEQNDCGLAYIIMIIAHRLT